MRSGALAVEHACVQCGGHIVSSGARWEDAFAVSMVTGMLIATFSMLIANRVLPDDLAGRADWEQAVFYGAWLLAFFHGIWRTAPVASGRMEPA